jgi:hypothetical protein
LKTFKTEAGIKLFIDCPRRRGNVSVLLIETPDANRLN